jgi:7-carboxy-7-deazaguanine synthase
MLQIARQAVYWTIQGEGALVGEPMIFVRLAGCSVGCASCDTNYSHWRTCEEIAIVEDCIKARESSGRAKYVWVTGGEPTDQDTGVLVDLLWAAQFIPCVATSGIRPVGGDWGWISVSPHTPKIAQRSGDEIKIVPLLNGLMPKDLDLSGTSFRHRYVQPMAGSRESLDICLDWIKSNPEWLFSPQSHKSWGVP